MLFGKKKHDDNADDRIKVDTSTITTMVGQDTLVKGGLFTKSSLRINGTVIGDVRADGVVILTKTGRIEGTIEAESIIVAGVVEGNMSIRDKVNVEATGEIYGDVITKKFVIDEESIFQGNCIMNRDGKIIPVPPYIKESEADKKAEEDKAKEKKEFPKKAKKKKKKVIKPVEASDEKVEKDSEVSKDKENASEEGTKENNIENSEAQNSNKDTSSLKEEKENDVKDEQDVESSDIDEEDDDEYEVDESEEYDDEEEDDDEDEDDEEESELDSSEKEDDSIIITHINDVKSVDDIPDNDVVEKDEHVTKNKNYIKTSKSLSVEIENQ